MEIYELLTMVTTSSTWCMSVYPAETLPMVSTHPVMYPVVSTHLTVYPMVSTHLKVYTVVSTHPKVDNVVCKHQVVHPVLNLQPIQTNRTNAVRIAFVTLNWPQRFLFNKSIYLRQFD